jgi:hypothetical protein
MKPEETVSLTLLSGSNLPLTHNKLNERKAAEKLGFSHATLVRYRRLGIGPKFIQAAWHSPVRYSEQALIDWLQNLERQSCATPFTKKPAVRGDNRLRERNKRAAR